MNVSALAPEINSLPTFARTGSVPVLQAGEARDGLVGEFISAAISFNSVTAGLVGDSWQDTASRAMTVAAT